MQELDLFWGQQCLASRLHCNLVVALVFCHASVTGVYAGEHWILQEQDLASRLHCNPAKVLMLCDAALTGVYSEMHAIV